MSHALVLANPVRHAMAHMKHHPMPAPNTDLIETYANQIAELSKQAGQLFSCEAGALETIKAQRARLEKTKAELESYAAKPVPHDFQEMSPVILGWRDLRGFPSLVPFSLESPNFTWEFKRGDEVRRPALPPGMIVHYDDVHKKLRKRSAGGSYPGRHVWIQAKFTGIIPPEARAKIKEASGFFGPNNISILTETKLKYNSKALAPPDPIAVAYYNGRLYHIAHFDLTPLEEAAMQRPAKLNDGKPGRVGTLTYVGGSGSSWQS